VVGGALALNSDKAAIPTRGIGEHHAHRTSSILAQGLDWVSSFNVYALAPQNNVVESRSKTGWLILLCVATAVGFGAYFLQQERSVDEISPVYKEGIAIHLILQFTSAFGMHVHGVHGHLMLLSPPCRLPSSGSIQQQLLS